MEQNREPVDPGTQGNVTRDKADTTNQGKRKDGELNELGKLLLCMEKNKTASLLIPRKGGPHFQGD